MNKMIMRRKSNLVMNGSKLSRHPKPDQRNAKPKDIRASKLGHRKAQRIVLVNEHQHLKKILIPLIQSQMMKANQVKAKSLIMNLIKGNRELEVLIILMRQNN
jgi:hypothetical protein